MSTNHEASLHHHSSSREDASALDGRSTSSPSSSIAHAALNSVDRPPHAGRAPTQGESAAASSGAFARRGDQGTDSRAAGAGRDMSTEQKRESEGERVDGEGRAIKRTRVEGRGSSAAQRAAASEACKSITLKALQAQYHRPLSDVARDLRVSVARLLKKCREFGILRWPYRHVRSVQESIDQLEKDREAATDDMATDDMELRLQLLRRRGELVAHFASCGLESEMRKGIFLADPRDVDAMLAAAHEIHGGRQIAPPGWDCLGRFPEKAARERFLERMRMYMIGGGTVLSLPDSPHAMGHVRRDSTSSLEDGRDFGQRQHQQQQQGYRVAPQHRTHAQWQHQQQQQQQQQHSAQQLQQQWQEDQMYGRGDSSADQAGRPGYLASYWPSRPVAAGAGGASSTGVPEGMDPAGGGAGGIGGALPASDFGRMRPAGRANFPAGVQPPINYAAGSLGQWQKNQPFPATAVPGAGGASAGAAGGASAIAAAAVATAAAANLGARHGEGAGGGGHTASNNSSSTSPQMRPTFAGPPGSSYYSLRPGSNMRGGAPAGADQREGQGQGQGQQGQQLANAWAGAGAGVAVGVAVEGQDGVDGGGGSGHRDMWRPPERLTPPPPPLGAAARRTWGAGDLANASGRSEIPPGGGGLPSIFERHAGLERPPGNFMMGPGGVVGATGAEGRHLMEGDAAGAEAVGGANAWGGAFQEPASAGYDQRWGGGTAAATAVAATASTGPPHHHQQQQLQQQQQQQYQQARWQGGQGRVDAEGVGGSVDALSTANNVHRGGDALWAAGARAGGMPGGGFDRQYGVDAQGGYRGATGAEGVQEGKA